MNRWGKSHGTMYGQSIKDPCIGREDNGRLLIEAHRALGRKQAFTPNRGEDAAWKNRKPKTLLRM